MNSFAELNLTRSIFISKQSTTRDRYEPTLLVPNTYEKIEWIQIECGGHHTVGLTKNGEVFSSWGENGNGQLGHGDREGRTVPTKVESLDELGITKISCGNTFTAALTGKGEILTWYVRS